MPISGRFLWISGWGEGCFCFCFKFIDNENQKCSDSISPASKTQKPAIIRFAGFLVAPTGLEPVSRV